MAETVEVTRAGGVVTVALNRPESHNAMTEQMIAELTEIFLALGDAARNDAASSRVIILTGRGRSFCAGADLGDMRAAADRSFDENRAGGEAIFDLMHAVDACPRPVIGRINGAAIGGGAGLVSCCDSVVAVARATFAFSEARLGLVPAVISPFVLARVGPGVARELFLTGERFKASRAREIGLVHHVAADEVELDRLVEERAEAFLQAAPGAQAAAKELIRTVAHRPKAEMRAYTSDLIARRRASEEGREGMSSFLEKREPSWRQGPQESRL
ncbi:MAG: enoyl-CoA hydratase-related protein [Candidatus Promineifilaceae bacterium]|nr:enoyl-CoA hydratase-related protein [Candidatus Promineifilaceae bacterium]